MTISRYYHWVAHSRYPRKLCQFIYQGQASTSRKERTNVRSIPVPSFAAAGKGNDALKFAMPILYLMH